MEEEGEDGRENRDDGRDREGEEDAAEENEQDQDEEREDEDSDNEPDLIPAYPFPFDYTLDVPGCDWPILVCEHLAKNPEGVTGLVLFFPGVHGGVGPCRTPGRSFDDEALYKSVTTRLLNEEGCKVNIFRCSWPYMRPTGQYSIRAAVAVLHHAMVQVSSGDAENPRHLKVVFVGHSLGGFVVLNSAEAIAAALANGAFYESFGGLDGVRIRVEGVCTLNGAARVESSPVGPNGQLFEHLAGSRILMVAGDADEVVPPASTADIFERLTNDEGRKRHLVLEGAGHDLFTHKAQLIDELVDFIKACTE